MMVKWKVWNHIYSLANKRFIVIKANINISQIATQGS